MTTPLDIAASNQNQNYVGTTFNTTNTPNLTSAQATTINAANAMNGNAGYNPNIPISNPGTATVVTGDAYGNYKNGIQQNVASIDNSVQNQKTATQQTQAQKLQQQIADKQAQVKAAQAAGYFPNEEIKYDTKGNIIPKPTANTTNNVYGLNSDEASIWSDSKYNLVNYNQNTDTINDGQKVQYDQFGNSKVVQMTSDEINNKKIADENTKFQNDAASVTSQIKSLQDGTFPLSSDQQLQLDNLSASFDRQIQSQQLANQNYEGGITEAGISSGRNRYAPEIEMGNIKNAVNEGIQKITDLNTQKASALAQMREGFKTDDLKMIQASWQVYNDSETQITKNLTDMANRVYQQEKDAKDAFYTQVTQPIQNVLLEASKNGATKDIQTAISGATSVQDAITKAGNYLQTASGTLGDYLEYKRETESKGLVPKDYQTYKDEQDAKDVKLAAQKAYATASATAQAQNANTLSDKVQQKLEQEGRTVISKEFSARTGALGTENAKVNQANHLNSLVMQYYDPKTGNYNIPKSQYSELVLGLANLVSPTGVASDSLREDINTKTAKGDLAGAIAYVTGVPQTGSTQDMIKNMIDSVDRQAQTAVRNRQASLDNMKDLLPTDLEQNRKDALIKATNMVGYEGQDRVDKTEVDSYIKLNPAEAANISAMFKIPGATNTSILQWLKVNNKIQ